MSKQQLIVLDKIDPNQLPELANFKEKGFSLLKECSFIKIEDNSTYEIAKKHRTALKSYRTDVQKSEKAIKDKINSFKNKVQIVSAELIEITQIAENKQQSEITAWEDKKEQERLEKVRLEQERIDGIKKSIGEFKENHSKFIESCVFESIEATKTVFEKDISEFDRASLQEFEVLFDDAIAYLDNLFANKEKTLTEQEQIRLDNLLIQEKNAENSRIQEWQRTWNANIDTLTFDDVKDVKSVLVKSKLADLKHYSAEYEEIYTSTEKRLNSQIQLISKAETQRIAQEKFQKEKAEFEAKQLEVKYQERKKFLVDEDYWRIYLLAECAEEEDVAKSKLLTYSDSEFEDFKLAVLKAKEPKEDIKTDEIAQSLEPLKEENILEHKSNTEEDLKMASEILENYHEEDVHEVAVAKTHEFANYKEEVKYIEQVETKSEVTWESIWEEYRENIANYDEIKTQEDVLDQYIKYLEANYNAPTKKQ